jgi:hypothetical protein
MPRMAYEVSSVALSSFAKAARELNVLEPALAKVSARSKEAFATPHRQSWWPAPILQELTAALAETAGPDVLAEVNYRMTRESMGPIVMPIIRVAMALTGRSPATVFARLNDAMAAGMRDVTIHWVPSGAKGGSVTFRYPEKVPTIIHHAWAGIFRFGYELTGHTGRTVKHEYLDERTLRLDVEWD